jgi:hypothetical protein
MKKGTIIISSLVLGAVAAVLIARNSSANSSPDAQNMGVTLEVRDSNGNVIHPR